jgi:hypothetical protein
MHPTPPPPPATLPATHLSTPRKRRTPAAARGPACRWCAQRPRPPSQTAPPAAARTRGHTRVQAAWEVPGGPTAMALHPPVQQACAWWLAQVRWHAPQVCPFKCAAPAVAGACAPMHHRMRGLRARAAAGACAPMHHRMRGLSRRAAPTSAATAVACCVWYSTGTARHRDDSQNTHCSRAGAGAGPAQPVSRGEHPLAPRAARPAPSPAGPLQHALPCPCPPPPPGAAGVLTTPTCM